MTQNHRNELPTMSERYERPVWVRRINAMADSVGGDARQLVPLSAEALLGHAARALGGLPEGDFGDSQWREHFAQLVGALDASPMHVVGRLMTRQELLRSLRTRILLTRQVEQQSSIEQEKIDAPLIVTGPARSGTTILFELLWLDSTLRAPLATQALHPIAHSGGTDQASLLAMTESEQEFWADVQPEFAAIHELRSDLPVECVTLTAPAFVGSHWAMISQLEGWVPDFEGMYEFERRALQVMQFGLEKKNWLLKTPGHLMTLEMLLAAFPDAWVVQTHRDPAKTMPSTVSTTAMVQWLRSDAVDLAPLSQAIEAAFGFALNHSVEVRRDGLLPDRFVDVHFQDMLRDPVGTLEAAYAKMNREFTTEHAERIRTYLADKPQGKFGKHRYSPEEWGFTATGLRESLKPYIEYFDVALE